MKNGQFNSENIMITYTEEIGELYQRMKLSELYQCFMMTQLKLTKMQMLCIIKFQKDTFGKI